MILVDNFKIILLVGLICTVGISPSDAENKCLKDAADEECTDATKTKCKITAAGPGGCAAPADCGDGADPAWAPIAEGTCDKATAAGTCCCDAKAESCNKAAAGNGFCTAIGATLAGCGDAPPVAGGGLVCSMKDAAEPVKCGADDKVCTADKTKGATGCAPACPEGVAEGECKGEACCCKAADKACNELKEGSELCKAAETAKLELPGCKGGTATPKPTTDKKNNNTVTTVTDETTPGGGGEGGATGLFENHFGLPLLALVSASMFYLPLKSLL